MASKVNFIWDVDAPDLAGLKAAFLTDIQTSVAEFVRGDHTIAILLRPVVASLSGDRPFDDDYASGDTFLIGIGNPDETPTGGTWAITVAGQTSGLTALDWDISAASLETAVNAAITAGGGGQPLSDVVKQETGFYTLTGVSNGAGPTITSSGGGANLTPASNDPLISVIRAGSVSTTWQQTIVLRQQPVALSAPATTLPAAGVTRTYTQSATSSQNNIVRITFDADGTYGGLYSISAVAGGVSAVCGQIGPLATAQEIGLMMALTHPGIFYQDTVEEDNIIVTKDGTAVVIEFTNDLSGPDQTSTVTSSSVANPSVITITGSVTTSRWKTGDSVTIAGHSGSTPSINGAHTITVTGANTFTIPVNVTVGGTGGTAFNSTEATLTVSNLTLLAPTGVSGTLNLNTLNLYLASLETDEDTLSFTLEIQRTRASGEVRTSLSVPVTIHKDVIDLASLVPVVIPSALTQLTGINFVQGVTGYTGGGATNFDGIVTAGGAISTGAVYSFCHTTNELQGYQLRASTDAESSPAKIRPDDYNGTTNARVWFATF